MKPLRSVLLTHPPSQSQAYTDSFEHNGYDGLIMPGLGITAPPHGKVCQQRTSHELIEIHQAADLLLALSYTFLANLLHWPAGTVPVTCVTPSEESYPLESLPPNQRDSIAKVTDRSTPALTDHSLCNKRLLVPLGFQWVSKLSPQCGRMRNVFSSCQRSREE